MSKPTRRSADAAFPQEQYVTDKAADLSSGTVSPAETAQYIAEFSAELSFLARQARLDLLTYLLDMARLEATRIVQKGERAR